MSQLHYFFSSTAMESSSGLTPLQAVAIIIEFLAFNSAFPAFALVYYSSTCDFTELLVGQSSELFHFLFHNIKF